MKGDFSRKTFKSEKHYDAVLIQQGRTQVDSDTNELQQIIIHRTETEGIDVIGRCGAPQNDVGFSITPSGSEFSISEGRFYVDGILCANEVELLYSDQPDLPNPADLNSLFTEAEAQLGIVYLDVWKHHITALDDPFIREVALGGPDTASREKIICQVKVLPLSETDDDPPVDLSCEAVIPQWDDLIAPSTGTLIAQTEASEADEGPCLLPPNAGYLRLENQLYRVEIHRGSESDSGATWKWSRENGSVVSEILQISGSEITVTDLGRDEVLGFSPGNWVEIIDDTLELNGLPGQLLQIDSISNDAQGQPIISMGEDVIPLAEGPNFPNGIDPERHPKIRRWDQRSEATSDGIPIAEVPLSLEGGIQVQFSSGTYQTGDYWLIPARTATGQIEWPMTDAPIPEPMALLPWGIEHHYCRLAIAQFIPNDDGGELSLLGDCITRFPPLTEVDSGDSCCTVVVQPGDDIQAAIDSLPPAGGCVCLKTGIHFIQDTIRVMRSNVCIKGECPGTQVIRNEGLNVISIAGVQNQPIENVVIDSVRFVARGGNTGDINLFDQTIFLLVNCLEVDISKCSVEVLTSPTTANPTFPNALAIGIGIVNSRKIVISRNTQRLTFVGIWAEGSVDCTFTENQLIGPLLQLADQQFFSLGYAGFIINLTPSQSLLLGSNIDCSNNSIQDFLLGVVVGVGGDHCSIFRNTIRRNADTPLTLTEFNNEFLAGSEPYLYGIIIYGNHCKVVSNDIGLNGIHLGGIRIFGTFAMVDSNTLASNLTRELQEGSDQLPISILVGQFLDEDQQLELENNHTVVINNKLVGTLTGIGGVNVEAITISENQILISDGLQLPTAGVALAGVSNSIVSSNQIDGADLGIFLLGDPPTGGVSNRILDNRIVNGVYGVGAISETDLEVTGNQIKNMTIAGIAAATLLDSTSFINNRINHCGYGPPTSFLAGNPLTGIGAGVLVLSTQGNLSITSCQVTNTGISEQGEITPAGTFWQIAIGRVFSCEVLNNQVSYTDIINLSQVPLNQNHRSIVLLGWLSPGFTAAAVLFPRSGSALITNNMFQGIGFPHLVEFLRNPNQLEEGFERVTFSHNQCFHLRTDEAPPPGPPDLNNFGNSTVSLWGRYLVVMGNQVDANQPSFPSVDLSNPDRTTLMGNIATGSIFNFGVELTPTSASDFNVFL